MRMQSAVAALCAGLVTFIAGWSRDAEAPVAPLPGDLAGERADDVLAALGVPSACSWSAQLVTWVYPTKPDGGLQVTMHGDVVVSVLGNVADLAERRRPPADGAYLGQHVAQLSRRLGSADSAADSTVSSYLTYPDGTTVTVAHGRVVGIQAPQRAAAPDLQGTWKGEEIGGPGGQVELVVTGNRMRYSGLGGREWYEGTFEIDSSHAPPRAVMTIEKCAMPQFVGTKAPAVFELQGDTMKFAGNRPGSTDYPTAFEPTGLTRVFALKRSKG